MPYAPPRHGANRVEANRKVAQRAYDKTKRKNAKFYHSIQWKKLRAWFIKQNPVCVMCRANGIATPVDVVDHIVEIEDGGPALDSNNLQSLCHGHHNIKTAQEREGRVKSL